MSELPKGWKLVEISCVFDVRDGTHDTPKYIQTGGYPLITSKNITSGRVDFYKARHISERDYIEVNKRSKVDLGDLLFSMIGTIGSMALVSEQPNYAIKNVALFKPLNVVKTQFLFYYLKSPKVVKKMEDEAKGTTQKFVGLGYLRSFPFPLPPLNEQKRIVVKLDKLFAHLDGLKARMERIPELLKQFRQSVLTQAVTGKLTEDWRKENESFYPNAVDLLKKIQEEQITKFDQDLLLAKSKKTRKPRAPKTENFEPLILKFENERIPHSWAYTNIGSVAECLDYLRKPINKKEREKRKGNIPYYGANGKVGTIDDYLFDEDLVVIVEDETFIGRELPFSYIIRGKTWVNNHAHVMRPLGGMKAEYLDICWAYYNFIPLTSGSTGRRKLTQSALLDAKMYLAPLEEQQEIVRRVEALFEKADLIEQQYELVKEKIEHLPQAILAKAFRGELVPQDPNDEPAEELLESIQAEKEGRPVKQKPELPPKAPQKQGKSIKTKQEPGKQYALSFEDKK